MADKIPDAAVGFMLENLKEFIQYNADLIGGLSRNAQQLYSDLDLMRAFIKKYTEINTDNDILEKLANDVRNLVHQAEDAIEEYIICETLQKGRNMGAKTVHFLGYVSDLRDVGKQIEDVSAKVRQFYQERAPLGLEALKIEEGSKKGEKKKKALVVEEDNVVGFEDEAEKVIELLTGESEQLEILSIIGMLGLGKTTLAKKVLNDPKVEYEFFTRAFVNVSQEYERREVFINILSALTQITPEITMMPDDKIIEILRKLLETRKYLIVMDDVWTREAWDDLKVAFPNNKKRSRVLITSRHRQVATHANPSKNPHDLRFMTGDESRELLRRKVFGENVSPAPHLQAYELRILDKCDGLPLAIVVIAGILLSHRDRNDWWEKVAEGVNDYVARDQSQSNDVIKLSFNHLPYHLKACFLYLGVFREDFEIPSWKLLRLWISEGFIQKDGDMILEDVAEDYLEDLVDRNLVMVGQRRSNGQIKTCRIHDTLRDFCKKEALKQDLFHEIKNFNQTTFLAQHPALKSYRRICINSNVYNYVISKPSCERVRSFLTFAKEETTLSPDHISSIPKAFRLLRVLEARSITFTRFPNELLYLVLLKYIAISCNFKFIPDKLSNLRNLQTIIIETSSRTLEFRADIWKLALLRHLNTNASTSFQKSKGPFVANGNLQTLSTISPESCTAEMFERSPNLKKLGICGKLAGVIQASGDSVLFDSLVKLEHLENLKLLNDDITRQLHALPRETNFPRNLRKLTLMNTLLDWRHMSTLGKLYKLEVLKLKDNAFEGELWETEDGGFRCLKVLHIGNTNLVLWKANANQFPVLTGLYLRHCGKLEAIPNGIADIASLQIIDLYCCTNPSVAVSARKIQLLKLQQLAQRKSNKTNQFKLAVYPPDQ